MKPLPAILLLFSLLFSCTADEKAYDILQNGVTNGAFLRTLEFNNSTFDLTNTDDIFSVELEEQDAENGALLERVDVYVRFEDKTPSGINLSTEEVMVKSLLASDFVNGPFDLPRTTLTLGFDEALEATGVSYSNVSCRDQFIVRLDLILTDGRSFTVGTGSTCIIGFDTFFSSPFCYTIHIVEPIDDEAFTGLYRYQYLGESVVPTFGEPHTVEIKKGDGTNVRSVQFEDLSGSLELSSLRTYRFTITCDESVIRKNQLRKITMNCGQFGTPILIGPYEENAVVSSIDDGIFELWFQEWSLGDFPTVYSKIRFSKQ